jgi:hypothetical protein
MPTLVRDTQSAEFEALLVRRRRVYTYLKRSRLIALGASELAEQVTWS